MQIDNKTELKNYTKNGSRVPAPPKNGEVLICQMCGQPLLPEHFSKDERQRRREFKWHIHPECFTKTEEMLDRSVPGLVAERSK